MQRIALALLSILLLSSIPTRLAAQEVPERLVLMTRYDIDLADDAAFREYMRLRVEAAREGGLAPEHGWTTLRTDNTWLILQSIPSLAALEDADVLLGWLPNAPRESTLQAARAALDGVYFTAESRLLEGPRALRHEPADPAPGNFAFVQEFRMHRGAEDARGEFVSFLGDIDLPYRYEVLVPRIGKDVVVGIVWPDDLLRYYQDYSPVVFLQRHPDRFGPITQRLRAQYRDMDTTLYAVQHAYSYPAR